MKKSKEQMLSERRGEWRQAKELCWVATMVLGTERNDQGFGVILDVSQNGLRVRTPQPPPDGAPVILRANAGEEIVEVYGTVRWVKEVNSMIHEFGVEILPHEPMQRRFLDLFVEDE